MNSTSLFFLLLLCSRTIPFTVNNDKLVTFDIITTFEGEIDPLNPPKIKTYIKSNERLYTIINPNLSKVKGKVKYVSVLNQHMSKDGKVTYEGSAMTEVEGKGQVGTNVQHFDLLRMQRKKQVFYKFSQFILKYLKHVLSTGKAVEKTLIQDLYNNYIYFGALAKGKNPKNEVYFKNTHNDYSYLQEVVYRAKTEAKTDGESGGTLSYSLANLNNQQGDNTLQQTFNINHGEDPTNTLALKARDNRFYNQVFTQSKSTVKEVDSKEKPSFGTVFTDGSSSKSGVADQKADSIVDEEGVITAFSKGLASSVNKREFSLGLIKKRCKTDDFDGTKFVKVDIAVTVSDDAKTVEECKLMKDIFNSL